MSVEDRETPGTLAIFAGGGQLPQSVAQAAQALGRPLFIIGMKDVTDPAMESWPISWWSWGEVGRLFKMLKANNCTEVVLIGKVNRPHIRDIKFDLGAITRLPKILSMVAGGDGDVLNAVIAYLQQNGITVVGAHEISPKLCLTEKVLGTRSPDRLARDDIAKGVEVARQMGALDIGQGVIVDSGRVVAVEAAEGTDAMIARSSALRIGKKHGRSGVLVKVPKPGQDLRVDMPTIGVATIEGVAIAGLAGVAVERGNTLAADKDGIRTAADAAGIFVATVEPSD